MFPLSLLSYSQSRFLENGVRKGSSFYLIFSKMVHFAKCSLCPSAALRASLKWRLCRDPRILTNARWTRTNRIFRFVLPRGHLWKSSTERPHVTEIQVPCASLQTPFWRERLFQSLTRTHTHWHTYAHTRTHTHTSGVGRVLRLTWNTYTQVSWVSERGRVAPCTCANSTSLKPPLPLLLPGTDKRRCLVIRNSDINTIRSVASAQTPLH